MIGGHKADVTVKEFVDYYLEIGVIGIDQMAALRGMARSSADKKEMERIDEAVENFGLKVDMPQYSVRDM